MLAGHGNRPDRGAALMKAINTVQAASPIRGIRAIPPEQP